MSTPTMILRGCATLLAHITCIVVLVGGNAGGVAALTLFFFLGHGVFLWRDVSQKEVQ